ncbi:MAG: ribonuclease H-like domain-containing protein [Methanocorpusculum sp.]|nr:ribonuclease H-like domain-containing protein [Methanocorpusculum sp.]
MSGDVLMFTPALNLVRGAKAGSADAMPLFGTEVSTPDGSCLKIESSIRTASYSPSEDAVRSRLLSDLTLVPGIGAVRSAELRRRGVRTLRGLRSTKWAAPAAEIADCIENGSIQEIQQMFSEMHRSSEPLLLGLSAKSPEHRLYFDIETLGMVHAPIILFGIGEEQAGSVRVTQYLIRDIEEEAAALLLTAGHFHRDSSVVTYNGRAFDIPYLNDRLAYYGERPVRFQTHFDLLHPTRRLFKNQLPDCCLGTVEEHILHLERDIDIPGALVPVYYQNYLRRKNLSILKPIVEHNKMDVANLARLLSYETELLYG